MAKALSSRAIGRRGEIIARSFFQSAGHEVRSSFLEDPTKPFDLEVKMPGGRWRRLQVKSIRGSPGSNLVFRFRKQKGGRRISYERSDATAFVLVDITSRRLCEVPFTSQRYIRLSEQKFISMHNSFKERFV